MYINGTVILQKVSSQLMGIKGLFFFPPGKNSYSQKEWGDLFTGSRIGPRQCYKVDGDGHFSISSLFSICLAVALSPNITCFLSQSTSHRSVRAFRYCCLLVLVLEE